jgi:O-acetyl-ADP-ribose deacetylase (regulator of RNase III)
MGVVDRMEAICGDITDLDVDAIINAANRSLLGGSGVDGAIHRKAGPGLLAECRILNGCEIGQAKLTQGYSLTARFVIHTVGPVYSGGQDDARLLTNCYNNSLKLAANRGLDTVAFPAISCGVYGYPVEEAAPVALETVRGFLLENRQPAKVMFVLFSENHLEIYSRALDQLQAG